MRCLRMATIPTAAVVPTIAISKATRRVVLPAPNDAITAPKDLTAEELRLPTFESFGEIFAMGGAPSRDEAAIATSFLRVLLFADFRAILALLDSLTFVVFPAPTALEPPEVGTFSTYWSTPEPPPLAPEGNFDAFATAGTTSAATRK